MAVSDRALALLAAQKQAIADTLGTTTDDLVVAWARAWDEIADELADAITALSLARPSSIDRARRARAALRIAAAGLDRLAQQAGVRISGDAAALIRQALADQPTLVGSQMPEGVGIVWNEPSPAQIAAMVRRTTQTIHKRTYTLSRDAEVAMKRALARGVAVGMHPDRVARQMLTRTEGVFNGGLTRAITLARTEMLDAYRAAAMASQQANRDVTTGWVWVSTLSHRTCPACLSRHGSVHPIDEPGPHDHPQGRCSRMPVTRSWSELGFDGIEEPPSALPDADAWFRGLSAERQRQILGPTRYELWRSGRFPMDQWAEDVSVPGWRDSIRVRRAADTSLAEAS